MNTEINQSPLSRIKRAQVTVKREGEKHMKPWYNRVNTMQWIQYAYTVQIEYYEERYHNIAMQLQ